MEKKPKRFFKNFHHIFVQKRKKKKFEFIQIFGKKSRWFTQFFDIVP